MPSTPSPHSDSLRLESPAINASASIARYGAEQDALADAWRAVDNAIRSIFELARSLEFLSDAIERLESDPLLEYQESDYSRYSA